MTQIHDHKPIEQLAMKIVMLEKDPANHFHGLLFVFIIEDIRDLKERMISRCGIVNTAEYLIQAKTIYKMVF